MSTAKKSQGNPKPSELVALAVAMHGLKLTEATGDARRQLLADAFWAWRLARGVIDTGLQSEREKDEEIDKALPRSPSERAPDQAQVRTLTLTEAASQLGYKETRGVRSVLELAEAMDKAEPRRFEALISEQVPGLAAWIRIAGVDETQLDALRNFKVQRKTSGRAAGGRSAALKKPAR